MSARRGFVLAALLLCLPVLLALAEELRPRLTRLLREGHPDLALAMIDDHVNRGGRLDDELKLLRAQLQTEGERFDRLASEFNAGRSLDDKGAQRMIFDAAREQFARGQYVSALERLRSLPPEAAQSLPELPIFAAMSAQAVGELRAARQELEAVPPRHPAYPMARILLADLLLRTREAPQALEQAKLAWKADDEVVGAQALYLQAAALTHMGRHDEARAKQNELSARFPRSTEATRTPELSAPPSPESSASELAESTSPQRRSEFSLQLGAFRDRSLALRLAERLQAQLPTIQIEHDLDSTPAWYRIVYGKYPTRSAAEAEQLALRQRGIESLLLVPGASTP